MGFPELNFVPLVASPYDESLYVRPPCHQEGYPCHPWLCMLPVSGTILTHL